MGDAPSSVRSEPVWALLFCLGGAVGCLTILSASLPSSGKATSEPPSTNVGVPGQHVPPPSGVPSGQIPEGKSGTPGGKAGGKNRKGTDPAAEALRKNAETCLGECRALKQRFDSVKSAHMELEDAVKNKAAWNWAESSVESVARKKELLDQRKDKTPFWQTWSTLAAPAWCLWARQNFTKEQVIEEAKHVHQLSEVITDMEVSILRIQNMHAASMAAVSEAQKEKKKPTPMKSKGGKKQPVSQAEPQ